MRVRGAYMPLHEFLHTYKRGTIHFEDGEQTTPQYYLSSERQLKIPDYQREYRWEFKHISELFVDLDNESSYLGQVALAKTISNDQLYLVVDGQQRLTTIIILYTMLVRVLHQFGDGLSVMQYELHKPENNSADYTKPRLKFDTNCFEGFQNFLVKVYELDDSAIENGTFEYSGKDEYKQLNRYIEAIQHIHKMILDGLEDKTGNSAKRNYINKLLENILSSQISVVVFEGDTNFDSERVFIDINEKGLRLDNEDILKAYYFRIVPRNSGDLVLATWIRLKKAYFRLGKKLGLESFVNYFLQIELLTKYNDLSYHNFDSNLRYKEKNKKEHICEKFLSTEHLQKSMEHICEFLENMYDLANSDDNSDFYKTYFDGRDSSTRSVAHSFYQVIFSCDLKLVYVILMKMWNIRKNNGEKLNKEDLFQVYALYIILNISGVKKNKDIFNNELFSAQYMNDFDVSLREIEITLLEDAVSKTPSLSEDKAQYISLSIQKLYNEFKYNNNRWKLILSNQEYLAKYDSNRAGYIKDHFLIQDGKTIQLYNGEEYAITAKMKILRKRAYNFIYHKDTYGNIDFFSRLEKIYNEGLIDEYDQYEKEYFNFIIDKLYEFYEKKRIDVDPANALNNIKTDYLSTINDFEYTVTHILEQRMMDWNQKVCNHLSNQLCTEYSTV